MVFQWHSGFITFTLEIKQFHLFIFFRFISTLSHLTTVTGRLYLIVDTYVKSRENPEHQYWPDQNRPIREKNPYWLTLSRIGRVLLSVSQKLFSSYLCNGCTPIPVKLLEVTSYIVIHTIDFCFTWKQNSDSDKKNIAPPHHSHSSRKVKWSVPNALLVTLGRKQFLYRLWLMTDPAARTIESAEDITAALIAPRPKTETAIGHK